jgi:hypothetical protein
VLRFERWSLLNTDGDVSRESETEDFSRAVAAPDGEADFTKVSLAEREGDNVAVSSAQNHNG